MSPMDDDPNNAISSIHNLNYYRPVIDKQPYDNQWNIVKKARSEVSLMGLNNVHYGLPSLAGNRKVNERGKKMLDSHLDVLES